MTKPITAVGGAHAGRGLPAAPRRSRRRPAARAGRPAGAGSTRGAARRHGPGRAADHRARPADLPLGPGHGLRRVRPAAGAEPPCRARARRRPAGAAAAAGARRVDARRRLGAARAPAGHPVAVPHERRHPRRAGRPGRGPAVRGQALAERVLGPLGMDDTAFFVPRGRAPPPRRRVRRRSRDRASGPSTTRPTGSGPRPRRSRAAAPGWCRRSTTWRRSRQMLLAGGEHRGRRLLARPTVEAMTTNQLTPAQLAAAARIPDGAPRLGPRPRRARPPAGHDPVARAATAGTAASAPCGPTTRPRTWSASC